MPGTSTSEPNACVSDVISETTLPSASAAAIWLVPRYGSRRGGIARVEGPGIGRLRPDGAARARARCPPRAGAPNSALDEAAHGTRDDVGIAEPGAVVRERRGERLGDEMAEAEAVRPERCEVELRRGC